MRRKIILAVVVVIYIVVAAVGMYLGHRKERPQLMTKPYVSSIAGSADTDDTLVFVERGGLWYHRGYCRELQKSGIPAKLSQVRGYCRPCTKCRPQR
jgi:energy-converting hydrogenase Eha subunit F